jgi:ribonuclease HI
MKEVEIYTDGACSGNPGKGGYAAILMYNGHEKVVSGYMRETTNNRMELFAILEGLRQLKVSPCKVNIYSDSAYCVDAFNQGWLDNWEKNNWKTANKDEVKNIDLWKSLRLETKKHKVTFIKVKGHSDNEHNNRCDELARAAISQCTD